LPFPEYQFNDIQFSDSLARLSAKVGNDWKLRYFGCVAFLAGASLKRRQVRIRQTAITRAGKQGSTGRDLLLLNMPDYMDKRRVSAFAA
jgi:hypothetical protein